MTKRTSTLTIVTFRVVEENDDDKPSLPPMPVDTTGTCVEEITRPLAKCGARAAKLKRLG